MNRSFFAASIAVSIALLCSAPSGAQDDSLKSITADLHGGIVVCVGYDGELTARLLSEYQSIKVQALESDADNTAEIHEDILEKKLFKRMTVQHWDKSFLPYADNLVNLVVVDGQLSAVNRAELERVLVPGGTAITAGAKPSVILRKPWPDSIDEWTHWLHSADGNPVAKDTISGPPKRVQWAGTPRHGKSHDVGISMTGMVTGNGKLFYIADDGPVGIFDSDQHGLEQWMLFCRDAFNGMLLWKKPVSDWGMKAWSPEPTKAVGYGPWSINPRMIHKRLVTVDDYLLVTLGFESPVSVLDASTGEALRTIQDSEYTSEIIVSDQRAYLVIDQAAQKGGNYNQAPQNRIVCADIPSGKALWKSSSDILGIKDNRERGFSGNLSRLQTILGDGKVYCLDRDRIIAMSAETGDEVWSLERPPVNDLRNPKDTHVINNLWDLGSMFYSDGILYYWQGDHPGSRRQNYVVRFRALNSKTGELLWERECHSPIFLASLPFFYKAQGMIWVEEADGLPIASPIRLVGLAPKTGEKLKSYDITPIFKTGHHHRCYPNKATENYVIYSRNGLEYVDLRDGSLDINRCVRGVCQYGIMPANGLLYKPADPCACFAAARINGYYALAGAPTAEGRVPAQAERLFKGPAFAKATAGKPAYAEESGVRRQESESDWPSYRHDGKRSGAAQTRISPEIKASWTASLGESITAPTISGGSVFLGGQDSQRVISLNADTGEEQWSVHAKGRLDTPPTVHGDSLFFGTDYGYVYCLDKKSGGLRWRFNANPEYRQIVNHERIESAWPVNGSVIADKNAIYFHCGRFSFMDGGLVFCKLDAATGEVLCQRKVHHTDLSRTTGTATDLLVYDGNTIYLKNLSLSGKDLAVDQTPWKLFGGNRTFPGSIFGAVNGFLDDSMFDRSGWHLQGLNVLGKIMVYDKSTAYWLQWKPQKDTWHNLVHKLGEHEYTLCSASRGPVPKAQRSRQRPKQQQQPLRWQTPVPVRVNALVLAENALLCAGTPASDDPVKFLEGFEGQLGGQLQIRDTQSGDILSEYTLPSIPVWDGMAAANGALFISMKNGDVQCLK